PKLAASARQHLVRPPENPVPRRTHREVQRDLGSGARCGMVAAHLRTLPLVPGGLAIEREADGVENAALARPRRARDQEQAMIAQLSEVQRLGAGIGTEGLQRQPFDAHQTTSRSACSRPSTVSSIARRCDSLNSCPSTKEKNAAK